MPHHPVVLVAPVALFDLVESIDLIVPVDLVDLVAPSDLFGLIFPISLFPPKTKSPDSFLNRGSDRGR